MHAFALDGTENACVGRKGVPVGRKNVPVRALTWILPLFLLGSAVEPGTSRAQSGEEEKPEYTMALVDVPLSAALEHIMDRTDLSLAYDPEMVAGRTTFCRAEEVRPGELLACALENTGLDYVRLSSGTYTLRPDARSRPLYAQVSGQVVDASTGEPLSGANVLLKGSGKGTAASSNGRFSFPRVKPGTHPIVVTHVGYQDQADTLQIRPEEKRHVGLSLSPQAVRASPIVVNGFEIQAPSDELAADVRTADQLTSSPQVGTPDVVQGLRSVAGVRLGDALSDVHLQGGGAGEQQFRLDGAPVFMPVSSGGVISPFSPFALNQVTVRKAGFGAEHGSALSGVIELDQRVAPSDERHLMARVDPLSVNVQGGGHFDINGGASGSWMLTGRHDLWDVYRPGSLQSLLDNWSTPDRFLLRTLRDPNAPTSASSSTKGDLSDSFTVGFTDLHGAVQVDFNDLSSLHLSFYRSANTFGTESVVGPGGSLLFDELEEGEGELGEDTEEEGEAPESPSEEGESEDQENVFTEAYRWRNRTGQISYEWVPGGRLFLSAQAWMSDYRLSRPVSLSQAPLSTDSTAQDVDTTISVQSEKFNKIREAGMRFQGTLATGSGHQLSGAVATTWMQSDIALSVNPFGASPVRARQLEPIRWRVYGFLEDQIAFGDHVNLTLGARLTYLPGPNAVHGEPRLSLRYDRKTGIGQWAVRWATGLYRQYVHSFDVTTYNVTSLFPRVRYWLPIGAGQRPPESYHTAASVLYRPTEIWSLRTEAYYKHQSHLLVLDYRESPSKASSLPLQSADGYAYGGAATVTRTGEKLEVEAQYEYAVSRRRVPGRFSGRTQPVPWSAPHRVRLSLDLMPRPGWTVTARWQGVWGRRWGFRQAYYDFLAPDPQTRRVPPHDFSNPSAHRLPPTSRLDMGVTYAHEVAGLRLKARATLINALGRENVTEWGLKQVSGQDRYTRDSRQASPFTPSVSLQVTY